MDTVTHALLGAAISDGFFRRRLGPVATPFALAAAALPDIDIVTYFFAPECAWASHRGYTHSFFFMLLAAPLVGYAGHRLSRRAGGWMLWFLLALACLYSHTLLDLATSWGTMPFLPFSNARLSWDIAPILDLFMFSLTAASFIANRILRWERVDTFLNPLAYPVVHRHPRRQAAGRWLGLITVCLATAYFLLGWHQNRQTVRIAREELARAGVDAVEVRALPLMLTYVSWGIAARDASGVVYNAVYSSYAPRPMHFVAHRSDRDDAVAKALATPDGRLFSWYSQGMFVAESTAGAAGGRRVTLQDRRFFALSGSYRPRFTMDFVVDEAGASTPAVCTQLGLDGVDIRDEARRLWNLTCYGEADREADIAVVHSQF